MAETSTQHANLGRDFESMLERTHTIYAARKLAVMKKHPVEWKFTSREAFNELSGNRQDLVARTNTGRYIARVRSYIDFSGVASGRFIAFDAKQVSRLNFPLCDLRPHQLTRLVAAEHCGGIAGLMIRFTNFGRIFFVPASYVAEVDLKMRTDKGRKSICLDDCQANGTEIYTTPEFAVHWLPALVGRKK